MKCPIDGTVLSIAERNEIEIDYCPTCRGVWLDRGELDKIIERANTTPAPVKTYSAENAPLERQKKKRKKDRGLLGEIFDFLD